MKNIQKAPLRRARPFVWLRLFTCRRVAAVSVAGIIVRSDVGPTVGVGVDATSADAGAIGSSSNFQIHTPLTLVQQPSAVNRVPNPVRWKPINTVCAHVCKRVGRHGFGKIPLMFLQLICFTETFKPNKKLRTVRACLKVNPGIMPFSNAVTDSQS